jgi:hypothetical protein
MCQKIRENMLDLLADALYLYPCTYTLIPIFFIPITYIYIFTPISLHLFVLLYLTSIPLYLYPYAYTLIHIPLHLSLSLYPTSIPLYLYPCTYTLTPIVLYI